jgi:hypothetical protein
MLPTKPSKICENEAAYLSTSPPTLPTLIQLSDVDAGWRITSKINGGLKRNLRTILRAATFRRLEAQYR